MALPATETFTASNNTAVRTLTNWDGAQSELGGGGFTVQSNAAQANALGPTVGADWWTGDEFDDDQYSEATIKSTANGIYIGVAVRCSGTDNGGNLTGYLFYSAPDDGCYIDEYSNGSYVASIAGPGTAFAVNDVVRLEINGSSLTAKVNGTTRLTVTDSSIASGSAGICAYAAGSSSLDDWEGGNLGAGPTSLTVADATHSHTADGATLTQAHALTVAAAAHAHTADNITLGATVALAIADATHAHAVDSIAVTQAHVVVADNVWHLHSVTSPVLTALYEALGASVTHAHAATSPTLAQAHDLGSADVAHAHSVEAPLLVQAHNLIASSTQHPHAVDGVDLTQYHQVLAAGVLHGHSIEEVLVVSGTEMAVALARHEHVVSAPVLSQTHELFPVQVRMEHAVGTVVWSDSTPAGMAGMVIAGVMGRRFAGNPNSSHHGIMRARAARGGTAKLVRPIAPAAGLVGDTLVPAAIAGHQGKHLPDPSVAGYQTTQATLAPLGGRQGRY